MLNNFIIHLLELKMHKQLGKSIITQLSVNISSDFDPNYLQVT